MTTQPRKLTKKQFEHYLNTDGNPYPPEKRKPGVKMYERYGSWLRSNEPYLFNAEYERHLEQHQA